LVCSPEAGGETLLLTFPHVSERERWSTRLLEQQQRMAEAAPQDRHVPEGVSLVQRSPQVPHVVVGRVESSARTFRQADRTLQLRAGIRGADVVIEVVRHKGPETAGGNRHVSGVAIRVEDAADRQRLRLTWYAEEVSSLVNRSLLLLVVQAVTLLVLSVFCAGANPWHVPTGETMAKALVSGGLGLGLLFAWPVLMLGLVRVSHWPQL